MVDDAQKADTPEAADSDNESPTLAGVEAEVEAKMAVLRGESEEKDDTSSVTDENVDSDVPTDSKDSTDTDADTNADADASDLPLLPSGYRRAALARGWTAEEIDFYLKDKPDEAVGELKRVYTDWQADSSRYSERGRRLYEADQNVSKADEKQETSEALSSFDAKALIEAHGNEDLINALVGPLNATIEQVNAVAKTLSHSEEFLRSTEEDALATATQEFLTSKEMEPYRDTFGVEVKDLTDAQLESRMELFKQADIIATGAKDHGMDITVQDALLRAHTLVSQGTRDEAIRQSIRDSMTKRTKTIKSSHQETPASDADQPISDKELEARTKSRMQALRNK